MKWLVWIIALPAAAALAVVGWVYAASELHLRSFERPPPFAYPIAMDSATIERGEHLVRTRGCRGCHGDDLGGELMWGMASAPNLAAYARTESVATFEAALRYGIGRDGKAMYSMPSYNFVRLRDEDVAAMFSYLQTQPVVERHLPAGTLPWSVRLEMALGDDAAIPAYLHLVPPLHRAEDANPSIVRGEYIAMTTCNECHGFGLRADSPWEGESAPDLMIVLAYDKAAFQHLMRTGKALGDRELDMMSGVARGRFAHFTDEEIEDVYAFLRDMSARASATH